MLFIFVGTFWFLLLAEWKLFSVFFLIFMKPYILKVVLQNSMQKFLNYSNVQYMYIE